MPNRNDLFDFDETTSSNNDNVQGANIAENCAPSGINNAIRGLASIVKRAIGSQGSAIASAATTAIAAAGTALYATVTGTTTVTSLGAVAAGTFRIVEFTGALTLTHNAASLKLPGAANIVTAAGDVGFFLSLGAGNWKCLHFSRVSGAPISLGSGGIITSTDPGAAEGPNFVADRNSASPAAYDAIGAFIARGRNSIGGTIDYATLKGKIVDATSASEDGQAIISTFVGGVENDILTVGQGVQIGAPAGGDPGAGKINATGYLVNGVTLNSKLAQIVRATTAAYTSTSTAIPYDDTIPQNTEGLEVLTVAITPQNAASTLLITVDLSYGGSNPGPVVVALFVDSTASALAARSRLVGNSTTMDSVRFQHAVSAGSTTARTYRVRFGPTAGITTAYLNGDAGTRKLGGVSISSIQVEEIVP